MIVLPRLAQRFARIRSQLDELGVAATFVQGRDARVRGTASIARSFMEEEKEQKAGVLALYQTHLAILDYALRSGLQRVLLLEDDAIFHADFPRVFDERVRIVAGRPFLRTKRHPRLSTFAYSRPAPLLPYESQISHFERPTRLHFSSGRTSSRTF